MLLIRHLGFSYPKRPLFKGLSLSVATKEVVTLLGPSGSGKTTLLRLILGMLKGDEGTIEVEGKMAYMGQEDLLLPWYTLEKNLTLFATMAGAPIDRIGKLLERVGLAGYEKAYPHELSKGMRQRAAFVRALLLQRPFLLLDEPFSNLDAKIKEELLQLLKEVQKEMGLSILCITHDFHDAIALSDRIVLLKGCSIVQEWVVAEYEATTLCHALKTTL